MILCILVLAAAVTSTAGNVLLLVYHQLSHNNEFNLSRDYNCDSTTTRLGYVVYYDTTTHSTTTEVVEIMIRLRYDYDVSRAPASIRRDSTRAKN